jgi:hypothetical protein
MKKINVSFALITLLLVTALVIGGKVHAQTSSIPTAGTSNGTGNVTEPLLYNKAGGTVSAYNSNTNSLIPGWYYTQTGSPRYYYANGVYYDPATQTYGGSILYPGAAGPQSGSTGAAEATISGASAASTGVNGTPATSTAGTNTSSNTSTGSSGSGSTGITGTVGTNGVAGTTFTPGVPNTGMGGIVLYAWLALILSAATAVVGTMYLTRDAS